MPEAPEIFYLKEMLNNMIKGKKILEIISNTKSVVNLPSIEKIIKCSCKGKIVWLQTKNYYIHLHMMLTGWIVFEQPKIYKYHFKFSDDIEFYIDDVRRFSKVTIIKTKEEHKKELSKLGYDFLKDEISCDDFLDIIQSSKKNVTALLLDQSVFCGIGNYVRNEALYLSKIMPDETCSKIPKKNIIKLYKKIRFVLFSSLYEIMKENNIKINKFIKSVAPKKIECPYKFKIYERSYDDNGNKVIKDKTGGRWSYYIEL